MKMNTKNMTLNDLI